MTVRLGGLVCLGLLPAWLSCVLPVTRHVTGRLVRALGMIRPGGGRRRSGARCWLDQELVHPCGGVTHHSLAVAVSLHSDRRHRTLRVEVGGSEVMLADQVDYVVGVDTHRDEHVLAVVVASTGAVVAQRSVPATVARVCAGAFVRGRARRAAGVCGRSRGQVITVPGSPVISAAAARRRSRRAAARVTSGGCRARTTSWTRSGRPGRCSPARRWHCHAKGSDGRLCGC